MLTASFRSIAALRLRAAMVAQDLQYCALIRIGGYRTCSSTYGGNVTAWYSVQFDGGEMPSHKLAQTLPVWGACRKTIHACAPCSNPVCWLFCVCGFFQIGCFVFVIIFVFISNFAPSFEMSSLRGRPQVCFSARRSQLVFWPEIILA